MKYFIIAADRNFNHQASHAITNKILVTAEKKGLSLSTLKIITLAKRWEDKLKPNEFKSGASAMDAINRARKILAAKKADLVMIKGEDLLKTGYNKEDREDFMKLYNKKFTPMDGYEKLVSAFLKYNKVTERDYFRVRNALFENYFKTWKGLHPDAQLPDKKWFQPLTKYFRGVDCANPNIDFSAQLLIANEQTSNILKIPKKQRIEILGNAFVKLSVDGFESIPQIASYLHLKKTINKATKEAGIDFKDQFLKGHAALDAYTCYPVVPMGLILKLGLVNKLDEIPDLLKTHAVTITGGLNLAKAAWNLTSLNSIISMRDKLIHSKKIRYGLSHGNGSIGSQQGITILGR